MAKSRIKSSELGAFRSSTNWMPCLNSVPITRVTSNFSYLSRAPEYLGGVANLLRVDSSLTVRVAGRVSVMSEVAVVVVVDMIDTINEGFGASECEIARSFFFCGLQGLLSLLKNCRYGAGSLVYIGIRACRMCGSRIPGYLRTVLGEVCNQV